MGKEKEEKEEHGVKKNKINEEFRGRKGNER